MKRLARVLVLTVASFGALTAMVGWSGFTALSALLTATTLVLVRDGLAASSRLRSFLTIACMYWGLSYVSNLIEAVYFSVIPMRAAVSAAVGGLVMALGVAALLELVTPAANDEVGHPVVLATGRWWRIPMLAFVFFLIYLAAGVAVHPWIAAFYTHMQIPTLPQLLRLQLCRGLLDLALVYPIYLQWGRSRRLSVWISACVFTILCGWGPLLLPNQFLPSSIRLAHAAEMGASGIFFGMLTAIVLLKPSPNRPEARSDLA